MKNHSISPRGTQAPSEKHLEDWLWEHPESLGLMGVYDDTEPDAIYDFLWRQFPVASGIVDLLGTQWGIGLAIVELKRGPIDTKAFAQLMRYMRDFQQMLFRALSEYSQQGLPYRYRLARHPLANVSWSEQMLNGVLIGNSCPDENLLIACNACGVSVYQYQFSQHGYSFEQIISAKVRSSAAYRINTDVSESRGLRHLISEMVRDTLEMEEEDDIRAENERFNAANAAEEYLTRMAGGEL